MNSQLPLRAALASPRYSQPSRICACAYTPIYMCACATALAPFPRLESFYRLLESKAEAHFEKRASEAQMGFRDAIDYMAAVNTPFPWAKHSKTRR